MEEDSLIRGCLFSFGENNSRLLRDCNFAPGLVYWYHRNKRPAAQGEDRENEENRMKLNLGENIRSCRRKMDMTQEQLAERLGVSFQSVSRWENGTTYPDMELLPVLAKIFGVTLDMLMRIPEQQAEENFQKLMEDLEKAVPAGDMARASEILREVRRNFDLYKDFGYGRPYDPFWQNIHIDHTEALPELRRYTETLLQNTDMNGRSLAVWHMSILEDKDHIDTFLDAHATVYDLTPNSLRSERYRFLEQWENLNTIRQPQLFGKFGDVLQLLKDPTHEYTVEYSRMINDLQFQLLHTLCNITPDPVHPVTGDGSADIFAEGRLYFGFRRACYRAAMGEIEEAFITLEDTVSLLETIMHLPEGTVLGCKSPVLNTVSFPDPYIWIKEEDHEKLMFGFFDPIGWESWVDPENFLYILTTDHGWEWFDPIRTDPRYQSYAERVKACIITRPKQDS